MIRRHPKIAELFKCDICHGIYPMTDINFRDDLPDTFGAKSTMKEEKWCIPCDIHIWKTEYPGGAPLGGGGAPL